MAKSIPDIALSRSSTYDFSKKKVPKAKLAKILEAARWAPSPLNAQPWRFVLVENPAAIRGIVAAAYYGIFHNEPPLLACIVLPRESFSEEHYRGMKNGKLGLYEAMLSVAMPGMVMALAAQGMGLSSCMLTVDEAKAAAILNLRSGDHVPLVIGMGFEERKSRSHGITHRRRPLESLVMKEKFRAD